MAKIKIVFDANPLLGKKTGVGTLTKELVYSLALHNSEYEFIGFYSNFLGLQKNLSSELPNVKFRQSTLIHPKVLGLLRKFNLSLPIEIFSKTKANIVLYTNFVSLKSIFKTKSIVLIYDLCFVDFPEFVSEKNGAYLRKWVPKSLKHADSVITISEFTKQRISDVYKYNPEKIQVISVPPKEKVSSDNGIIKKIGLEDYILFIGTLEPRKNIIGLLESYELLNKELLNKYPLMLVGDKGWKDDSLLQKIKNMNEANLKVIQTGYVTDEEKSALYESATLVIQLSHYEGFGMPVLEAMSYGKPVICSDIPVFHEIAQNSVIYVNKDNPENVSKTINDLLMNKSLREDLSRKSLSHTSSYPKWQDVAHSLKHFFNSLII